MATEIEKECESCKSNKTIRDVTVIIAEVVRVDHKSWDHGSSYGYKHKSSYRKLGERNVSWCLGCKWKAYLRELFPYFCYTLIPVILIVFSQSEFSHDTFGQGFSDLMMYGALLFVAFVGIAAGSAFIDSLFLTPLYLSKLRSFFYQNSRIDTVLIPFASMRIFPLIRNLLDYLV